MANEASELARAYIRRARETMRTGMLIFSFSSTLRSEVVISTVKHIVLELFREVRSSMQMFSMVHESLAP